MSDFSSQAIMLRRIAYGDYDLIVSFFTLGHGKIAAIAKSAKKSRKRFSGILEPFSELEILCTTGRGKGMPILKEAAMIHPFPGIRTDIKRTGYASYWAEIVDTWLEERVEQAQVYHLFQYVLERLDQTQTTGADLSILFQMRFLTIAGLVPNLNSCCGCKEWIENMPQTTFGFDLSRGGLVCDRCGTAASIRHGLSKGTIKQLMWVQKMDLPKAARIKFTFRAQQEGLSFLETFVPYHLGKVPRSLNVLRQLRR